MVFLAGGAGVLVDVPAKGVDGFGVGAFEPFFELSLWPSVRKCEETARAPAAAEFDDGAMLA